MSRKDLARFCLEHLPKHPELKQSIYSLADQDKFASALVEAGNKAGFNFSRTDVDETLSAASRTVELSDQELESVAGGLTLSGSTYLYFKFDTVLISGAQSTVY